MGNTFGQQFRVTTYGESHGGAVGVVIDGCPPGYPFSIDDVQAFLDRRRPGQSHLSTPRGELDRCEVLSGVENGVMLGTPISLMVRNKDAMSSHYADLAKVYRPSHADYTTQMRYGVRASSGGGRASARETIGRVAAAAVAEQVLRVSCPEIEVVAFVDTVKDVATTAVDLATVSRKQVEEHPLRCPDPLARQVMEKKILEAKKRGDSVGGTIQCVVRGCPAGLGDPVFDKLEADLAKAMMSLPASKGFEIGMGFAATQLYGSEHNDPFINKGGKIGTQTNRSGGVQGGISNGEDIYFRVAFKPVATVFKEQKTVDEDGRETTVKPKQGRHDPCVLPRAVPMVEAMALLVIMDHYLRFRGIKASAGSLKLL